MELSSDSETAERGGGDWYGRTRLPVELGQREKDQGTLRRGIPVQDAANSM